MEWTCRCGAFAAEVETRRGIRAVCYCASCRDFAERMGASEALDSAGGSDLFQVAPEEMTITRGADRLGWLKLTEKGPARWFTTCCHTPLANTLDTPAIPFVTLQAHRLDDPEALGPVKVRAFRRDATARAPDDGGSVWALYWDFTKRAVRSRLSGGWRRNPLFGPDRQPIVPRTPVEDIA